MAKKSTKQKKQRKQQKQKKPKKSIPAKRSKISKQSGLKQILAPQRLFLLLGMAFFIAMVFSIVMYTGERAGIIPWMYLNYLPGLTSAENVIVFIGTVVFAFFIVLLCLSGAFLKQTK